MQRTGCLGGTRALMKQSVQYLPVTSIPYPIPTPSLTPSPPHFTPHLPTPCLCALIPLLPYPIQVIGWSMWFSEYMFLARNWAKDEAILKVHPNSTPKPKPKPTPTRLLSPPPPPIPSPIPSHFASHPTSPTPSSPERLRAPA